MLFGLPLPTFLILALIVVSSVYAGARMLWERRYPPAPPETAMVMPFHDAVHYAVRVRADLDANQARTVDLSEYIGPP